MAYKKRILFVVEGMGDGVFTCIVDLTSFIRFINPLKDMKAVSEVKGIAKEVQPEIIHLHREAVAV